MSTTPKYFKKPCSPQTHPAGIQYTIVLIKLNKQYALKLHLKQNSRNYLDLQKVKHFKENLTTNCSIFKKKISFQ